MIDLAMRLPGRRLLFLLASSVIFSPANLLSQLSSSRAPDKSYSVAMIRPSSPDSGSSVFHATPDSLHVRNTTLASLIKVAYFLQGDELVGGPSWINSKGFDIEAKSDAGIAALPKTTNEQATSNEADPLSPFQQLLQDRFGLKVHKEMKEVPVYALVVVKSGSKLRPSNDQSSMEQLNIHDAQYGNLPGIRALGRGQIVAIKTPIDQLVHSLTTTYFDQIGRRVINTTGLMGQYDFRMEWTPDPAPGADPSNLSSASDSSGPSLFTAIQDQLGLKLEPQRHSMPVLVIDQAEMPLGN